MTLVDHYRESVHDFSRTVSAVRPDQWSAPTPCVGWDVRTLVNHVVAEQLWSVPLFAGQTIAEVGDRFDGDVLGADPAATAAQAGTAAAAAVIQPDAMRGTVNLSIGDTPATEYVSQLFADHLLHRWDLAVAIGADRHMPDDAVRACLDWFADRESLYRSAGVIGAAVALPTGASDQDRLIAAFGRDPATPSPPSP